MPISLSCACGRAIRAKDELAGLRVKCPQCGAPLTVPKPAVAEDRLLPLDDPWKEPGARSRELQPEPADDEVLGEVLPVDAEEDGGDENDDGQSLREKVRRKDERAAEREAERKKERRKKRRREEDHQELVEMGRFRVRGSRGYLENITSGTTAGIVMIVLGLVAALFSTLLFRGMGQAVTVIPVGAIVCGVAAILVGLNKRSD